MVGSAPLFAAFDGLTAGDNTLVAAVAGRKIRVLAAVIAGTGAATVAFESTAGGDALTGDMGVSIAAEVDSIVLPHNPAGWFETVAGELLNLEVAGAGSVSGCLTYVLIDD